MTLDQNLENFEKEWVGIAEEIVRRIFANAEIQRIKQDLIKNGSLSWEQKSEFIVITDKIKNDLIQERYGDDSSQTYQEFLKHWQQWQKERGRKRDKASNLFEENINHFLYGSTPDPEGFLREFDINK